MTTRIIIILLVLCLGCSEDKRKKNNKKNAVSTKILGKDFFRVIGEDIDLKPVLPDTVLLKDTLKGHLVYKSYLDTIPTDSLDVRALFFYLAEVDSPTKSYDEFLTKKSDTFARIMDSIIPIFDITFDRAGNHLFEGFIMDQLFIDENNDSIRIKSDPHHIIYRVYVK